MVTTIPFLFRGHIFDIERELGIEGHIKFIASFLDSCTVQKRQVFELELFVCAA